MDQNNVENFEKLIGKFKMLTTKVQKDNRIKWKNLEDTNLVLDACKKEYQRFCAEYEILEKYMWNSKRNY